MFGHRPDATAARDVPPYRRMMPYLMRGRNESAVYFEQQIDVTRTLAFIDRFNAAHADLPVTPFHVVTWAAVQSIAERPRLNRFVAGSRLWQRDGIWISYSAKKRIDDDAPVVVLKRRFEPEESFEQMVRGMAADLGEGRSGKQSHVDKELGLVLAMPGPALRVLVALERALDALGLMPRSYIDGDPMYASLFIANLGSLKMDAAYHHLYEYGNIPIFCVIGQLRDLPVVKDGRLVAVPTLTVRYSYDERIEDGLYAQRSLERLRARVEDPLAHGASADA